MLTREPTLRLLRTLFPVILSPFALGGLVPPTLRPTTLPTSDLSLDTPDWIDPGPDRVEPAVGGLLFTRSPYPEPFRDGLRASPVPDTGPGARSRVDVSIDRDRDAGTFVLIRKPVGGLDGVPRG